MGETLTERVKEYVALRVAEADVEYVTVLDGEREEDTLRVPVSVFVGDTVGVEEVDRQREAVELDVTEADRV